VCQWTQTPYSLIGQSGYQLNMAALMALGRHNGPVADCLFIIDRHAHASLNHGVQASGARWKRFKHNDVTHLEHVLKTHRSQHPHSPIWVVTESLFSMSGSLAPLSAIASLCQQYTAGLYVDEAHACGVYGDNRHSGWAEACGAEAAITIRMGTFSKALGCHGAWLAMHHPVWRDYLINYAPGWIYSTNLPPGVLAANVAAIQVVQQDPTPHAALAGRLALWYDSPLSQGADAAFDHTGKQALSPIVAIPCKTATSSAELAATLQQHGYWTRPMRPPTVPKPQLRLTLSARQPLADLTALKQLLPT
jgi:8-amino-7-oxononanoate synthase